MISVYALKPKFQNLLRPLVQRLADSGVSPNQVTVAAIALSVITGAAIAMFPSHYTLLLVPVTLIARMALNAIDGMLAREFAKKSSLGAILNELGDVVSDIVLYLPLALLPGFNPTLVIIIILLAVISEMTGVIAVQIGTQRRYDGPMGKSDRAAVFGIVTTVLGLGVIPGLWLNVTLALTIILLCVTIFKRARNALKEIH